MIRLLFIAVCVVATVIIGLMFWRSPARAWGLHLALGMILSGALGNLYDRVLYRAFALRRGTPAQLYGWSVWKRGWEAGVKNKHGIGWLRGDSAQMPGAFVVSSGRVVAQFVHETAADRPDYVDVASEGAEAATFEGELEHAGVGGGFREQLRALLSSDAGGEG